MNFDIERVAKLAKLKLSHEEIEKFQEQLTNIIDMVENLPELEKNNMAITIDKEFIARLREDECEQSLTPEELLVNAPQTKASCFIAPHIINS